MTTPWFSIVIPTLNEAKYLPALLKDLAEQSWRDFEVVVVDGGSEDQTLKKAREFSTKIALTLITEAPRNVSHQRNQGAKAASGEWIIFMDADNRLPSYFLLGLKYQLEKQPKTKAFTTWMDSKAYRNRDESLIASTYNLGLHAYAMLKKPTAVGALIGVHKKVTATLKFREAQNQFEDYDYILQVQKHRFPFCIFRDPTYTYSMRRFQKEGTLKMVRLMAQANINSLLGRSNTGVLSKYVMEGGSHYTDQTAPASMGFLTKLDTLLRTVPKNELQKLQDTLADLLE